MNLGNRLNNTCNRVWATDDRSVSSTLGEQALVTDEFITGLSDDERFEYLMSLALDDMLEPDEAKQFDAMLADTGMGESWDEWQRFDTDFRSAPVAQPSSDFVSNFENRLHKQQRRRRIWYGIGIGAVVLILWINLTLCLLGAGAYVMFNQASWLTATVRLAVYISATIEGYITVFSTLIASIMGSPEAQFMAALYITLSGLALWAWTRFLRKSTSPSNNMTTLVS